MNTYAVQISDVNPRWIDNFTSALKKYKKKKISIISCISSCEKCDENFVSNIVQTHEKKTNKLQAYYNQVNPQLVVMRFCYSFLSLELIRSLKFMTSLTDYFLIYLNPVKDILYDTNSLDIIYSLFFYKILEIHLKKKISIFFIVDQSHESLYNQRELTKLQDVWRKCLADNNINDNIDMNDYFEIFFFK
mmetsp:Transcript_16869/g.46129  ORF Transcript_16869/g.46129 Transcript_16869/m.46129 type:complete len:190 (+) Transcript_16869:7539-8108(+)